MVEIALTVCCADRVHPPFSIMSAECGVIVRTADKGAARRSAPCLHGCRKLSTILEPIGVLMRLCLSADTQPPGSPRIHQL
ncbi:hypothetical protein GCM10010520_28160 [Rhizobium viscosum]